jgi:hypothetical protein
MRTVLFRKNVKSGIKIMNPMKPVVIAIFNTGVIFSDNVN